MNVGKNIKLIRFKAGLNQKRLAKILGISAAYLSQVESGRRNPSMNFLQTFSKKLDVPIGLIFLEESSELRVLDPAARTLLEAIKNILLDTQATRIKKTRRNVRQIASG